MSRPLALVTDEFGSIVGLVTLNDVMEAIVGEFPTQDERAKPEARKRADGLWLIDAMIDLESVERALPGFTFGVDAYRAYQTLAGFVVKTLGHVSKEGETFEAQGYVFGVLDMDRHRVDKVLVMAAKTSSGRNHERIDPPMEGCRICATGGEFVRLERAAVRKIR